MHPENIKTINYFNKVARKLFLAPTISDGLDKNNFTKNKTRLAKTNEEARMNARIDAAQNEKVFDESQTPKEELLDISDKYLNALIERNMDNILGE